MIPRYFRTSALKRHLIDRNFVAEIGLYIYPNIVILTIGLFEYRYGEHLRMGFTDCQFAHSNAICYISPGV